MTPRAVLELRSRIRRTVRRLFDARGFLEVDTPVLASEVLPEAHIDPLAVPLAGRPEARFLQASPEALMKRLLAAGSGPIYQLAHAFRDGERGPQHDIEFMLLEWYAPGTTLDDAADLMDQLCGELLGTRGIERIACRDAFALHAGVDPLAADPTILPAAAARAGLPLPADLSAEEARDRGFELLLADVVQPRLGHERPVMLEDWPESQAAFARIVAGSPPTARRFEVFVRGVELANGWEEETDRERIAARIAAANRVRQSGGRTVLPEPARLLAAHEALPEGVGVALGFDRLVMLAAGAASIDDVRNFPAGG